MLPLNEITSFYPQELQRYPRFLLREYLQCKILEIIYESDFAQDLTFLGGTCLRIIHGNRRFSEDLDFDNKGLEETGFEAVASQIQIQLERVGYSVELKTVMRGAWHCHIRFPGLLFEEGLSGYQEEKILIQLDTEPQHYEYQSERFILNRFEVFTTLLTTPLPLLLSQKLYAIINRFRNKGRDFYDTVFLLSKDIRPDYGYLDVKLGITSPEQLKDRLLEKCQSLNMDEMAKDVEPFLFDSGDRKKVTHFVEVVGQYSF